LLTQYLMATYVLPTTLTIPWHDRCISGGMKSSNDTDVLTCVIDMLFNEEQVERAVQLLLSTIDRTESKAGCLSCSVTRDAIKAQRVRYNEIWKNEAVFRKHVQSEEFQRVLVAMDMSSEKPTVTVGTLTGKTGIAYLRGLHDSSDPATILDDPPQDR